MRDLNNSVRSPRRFRVLGEDSWVGKPSIAYGVIRRLAFEDRKKLFPYLRVFLGDVGRRGDPWGGLGLEINGQIYRFGAGVTRWPEYHDGHGELTEAGKRALALGVPGLLSRGCDWRWVQDELDLTELFSPEQINRIALYYADLMYELRSPPSFQARMWSKRLNVPLKPDHHNCTTLILSEFKHVGGPALEDQMPLPAFDNLLKIVPTISGDDTQLHALLSLSETQIMEKLNGLKDGLLVDWNLVAKSAIPIPSGISWVSLNT